MVVLGENGWNMPTSLNMKLITFNKAFEIENIIAAIPGFFHHNMSKLDQAKWDLSSLTWLNLKGKKNFEYGPVCLDTRKDESIQSCESPG